MKYNEILNITEYTKKFAFKNANADLRKQQSLEYHKFRTKIAQGGKKSHSKSQDWMFR